MTVLITGANRGIGRALAEGYAARGAPVIGTARGGAPADAPAGIEWLPLDVTDAASVTALGTRLNGRSVGLLVCNAGVYLDKAERLDTGYAPALWAETFAANVTGVFGTIQTVLPALRRAEAPRIAVIGSVMGVAAQSRGGAYIYRASKAAVMNLARNLAADLAPEGIAVGAYHPGWVVTEMGGAGADISAETAAEGLMARFDALSPATSGVTESYDGSPLAF